MRNVKWVRDKMETTGCGGMDAACGRRVAEAVEEETEVKGKSTFRWTAEVDGGGEQGRGQEGVCVQYSAGTRPGGPLGVL